MLGAGMQPLNCAITVLTVGTHFPILSARVCLKHADRDRRRTPGQRIAVNSSHGHLVTRSWRHTVNTSHTRLITVNSSQAST